MATVRQIFDSAREWADGVGANRWKPAGMRVLLSAVHRAAWVRVLTECPNYRAEPVAAPLDGEGALPLVDLAQGTGETRRTFYRVLGPRGHRPLILVADLTYVEGDPIYPLALAEGALTGRLWWREGDRLRFLPARPHSLARLQISTLPQSLAASGNDDQSVPWVEGYEEILGAELARLMLGKGGAEGASAREIADLIGPSWRALLTEVRRASTGPMSMQATDDPRDWGG